MIAQRNNFVIRSSSLIVAMMLFAGCASSPEPVTQNERRAPQRIDVGHRAAQVALEQVGVPYRFGGQTPAGFDCSGLVHYAYLNAGTSVPRTTGLLWSGTTPVARSELRVGDVLFFSIEGKMSHVGLYLGGGRFVHAPSTGRAVTVETLSSSFYSRAFLRGGRPR